MIIDSEGLECPFCHCAELHQIGVNVFFRNEDDDVVQKTAIMKGSKVITTSCKNENSGNPSPRRDGLSILFDCEFCDDFPELYIYQHKGSTYFEWRE